jgi:pilus assembly protein CpaE
MDPSPVTVLIIDGDAASRNYLSAMLTKEGFQVLAAALGREGLISAWKDQPSVIIFDPVLPDLTGLELVTRLRQDRRTSDVMCLALASREDAQEMSALLAAGCNEYMLKSVNAMPRLFQFLPRASEKKHAQLKKGKLISFLSAKGGMGTSSLCANIAMCAASANEEMRVAVLDLVLPIGSIANIVGSDDHMNLISTASQSPEITDSVFFTENLPAVPGWHFHLLAGSQDPPSTNQLVSDRVAGILSALLGSYDYLFVDLGRSLSRISLPIIQHSNVLALILGTDLATCAITKTVCEFLQSLGVDSSRIYAIQNRSIGLEGLSRPEVEKLIGVPVQHTIPYLIDNLTVANNRHEPFLTMFPNDATAMVLQQIASQMIEMSEKQIR